MLIRRLKQLRIICYVLVAAAILLGSSGVHAENPVPSPPQSGGELVVSLYDSPPHLNPAIQSGLLTAFPGAQIFAGLLRFDNEWHPKPYLAERWEISEDGLSVTFHLVKNAVFHDGKPITSEDVAFSIMTVKTFIHLSP